MKLSTSAASILLLGIGFGLCAQAQEIDIYLELDYDVPTRDFYAYASTSMDYTTGYYYQACVALEGTWPTGGYYGGFGSGFAYPTCSGTTAEQDYSSTLPSDSDWMEVQSEHDENVEYYTYQFDGGCTWSCNYYWDALEASSILSTGGGDPYSGPAYFMLGGPPGYPIQDAAFQQRNQLSASSLCEIPTGETSHYDGNASDGISYLALFDATLTLPRPAASFVGRTVKEYVSPYEDGCLYEPNFPSATLDAGGTWTVTSGNKYAAGSIGTPSWDGIGAAIDYVTHYQDKINQGLAPYTECHTTYVDPNYPTKQQMYMACSDGYHPYETPNGHPFDVLLKASTLTSKRGTASGAAK